MSAGEIPEISVVVPVCNEEGNVVPLLHEISVALSAFRHEILFIDDGSTDGTLAALRAARSDGFTALRILQHSSRRGQSAALCSGVRAARAPWIATLDGDGQNDPADIPRLYAERARADLIIGHRTTRRDTAMRRMQSRIANVVRGKMLGDQTPDAGCGIKVMNRELFLQLPRFDHMHRFLPALFRREGAEVLSVPVNHRERGHGVSKYGLFDRLWVGIVDIFGVMWLRRRHRSGLSVLEDEHAS